MNALRREDAATSQGLVCELQVYYFLLSWRLAKLIPLDTRDS
jgi:hypothetical protein